MNLTKKQIKQALELYPNEAENWLVDCYQSNQAGRVKTHMLLGGFCSEKQPQQKKQEPLTNLLKELLCKNCSWRLWDNTHMQLEKKTLLKAVFKHSENLLVLKYSTSEDSTPTKQKRLMLLTKSTTALETSKQTLLSLSLKTHAYLEKLLKETNEQIETAKQEAKKDIEKSFLEIKKIYTKDENFLLDMTPTIWGITYYREEEATNLLKRIVTVCSLKTGNQTPGPKVLLLPRYVADWIMQSRQYKINSRQYTVMPEKTDSLETMQTGAELWDPDSTGALKSLQGAIEAGRKLLK